MPREYASLRRRPFLTPLWLCVLGGCVTLAMVAWAVEAASTTMVLLVASEPGTDPAFSDGLRRAARLVGTGRAPATSDTVLLAAPPGRLVEASGVTLPLTVVTDTGPDELAARVLGPRRGGRVVVIGAANTLRALGARLGVGGLYVTAPGVLAPHCYVLALPRFGRPGVLALDCPA